MDGPGQPLIAVLPPELEALNPLAGSLLRTLPFLEQGPKVIVRRGPLSRRAPLGPRGEAHQRPRLAGQHLQLMLEVEPLLPAAITALMVGHFRSRLEKRARRWGDPDPDLGSRW